jgi:hypothetical protein
MIANKRGQAAIEFLTTYGWALLVIAIVLVALSWLGVFSPQNVIQEYCSFPVGTLGCENLLIQRVQSSWICGDAPACARVTSVELTNNFGKDIGICVWIGSQEPANPATGFPKSWQGSFIDTLVGGCTSHANLKAGETAKILPIAAGGWLMDRNNKQITDPVGSTYRGKLYLWYHFMDDTSHARLIVADISGKIEPG